MESAREKQPTAPHVLIFPLPVQGLVNSMFRLADALSTDGSDAGLHVTFLNTDHNHGLLCNFSSSHARLSRCPLFRFRSIPDGLPADNPRSLPHFLELMHSLRTRSVEPYREILRGGENEGWPPVTCVVVDGFIPFAVDAAQELGIPAIVSRTVSAASLWQLERFRFQVSIPSFSAPVTSLD
ncbi:hypothetical protein HPP92_018166 [Vanilla planifolia]|uniref:Uncharacterized protein n=1 Tax=Vanilla planifolia TaxID=51239 RepID=A0A835UP55_VANPL|nr:hypothetical protein HPP92_018166 [Vanilla planifolia]